MGLVASLTSLSSAMWEWESMMPGVRYLPPASMTVASAGAVRLSPTAAILPSWMRTLPFLMLPWVTVMTTAFLMSTAWCAAGADWAAASATDSAASAMSSQQRNRLGRTDIRAVRCLILNTPVGDHEELAWGIEKIRNSTTGEETGNDRTE